jgi:hypothetical protein
LSLLLVMVMGDGGKKKLFFACDGSQGLAKLSLNFVLI